MSIDARTPIGTKIKINGNPDSILNGDDYGVIVGATSQVVLYKSDIDGNILGIAAWEFDNVDILD